jgi:hypothetical protein
MINAMNGMSDINRDLQYLQVTGINQFKKEFEQQRGVPKNLDFNGLHRNENTEEIEGYHEHVTTQLEEQVAKRFSNGSTFESTVSQPESVARKKKAPPFKHSDIDYSKLHIDEVIEEHMDPV